MFPKKFRAIFVGQKGQLNHSPGEPPDAGADDPEEVVHGAEEVAADQEEARHEHVQEKSGGWDIFMNNCIDNVDL